MRMGRLYPVAVALVVRAMLGAVSVGWNTLGATARITGTASGNSDPPTRAAERQSRRPS